MYEFRILFLCVSRCLCSVPILFLSHYQIMLHWGVCHMFTLIWRLQDYHSRSAWNVNTRLRYSRMSSFFSSPFSVFRSEWISIHLHYIGSGSSRAKVAQEFLVFLWAYGQTPKVWHLFSEKCVFLVTTQKNLLDLGFVWWWLLVYNFNITKALNKAVFRRYQSYRHFVKLRIYYVKVHIRQLILSSKLFCAQ